jgi:hypothetical protein
MKINPVKRIKIRTSFTIQTLDTEEHSLNFENILSGMENIRVNKLIIIENAYHIESIIQSCISYFLFGTKDGSDKRLFFETNVLNSNWCSFSSKRKLIKSILDELVEVESKTKAEIDKEVGKVMKYRNAFTHGLITIQSDGDVRLTWSEDRIHNQILNDDFFNEIVTHFDKTFKLLDEVDSLIIRKYLP